MSTRIPTYKGKRAPRKKKVSILLNDTEMHVLEKYCKRYRVTNRSKLIRETLMRAMLKQFDKDQPTLFD